MLPNEGMFVPILLKFVYGRERMVWRQKERSRIRRKDREPNVRIRELCGVTNGVNERIEEN